jgi:hypothetical protein
VTRIWAEAKDLPRPIYHRRALGNELLLRAVTGTSFFTIGGEVVVRSSLNASSVAAGIRQAVRSIDKNLPVTDIEPLNDALGQSISQERFRTFLLGSFSAIALVLAAVGMERVMDPNNAIIRRCAEGMELEMKGQIEEAARLFAVAWDGSSDDFERCIAAQYVARHQKIGSRPWRKCARYASSLAGGSYPILRPLYHLATIRIV